MEIRTFLDRIEGDQAVLIDEEERQAVIPAIWIPKAREGMALTLSVREDPEREAAARREAEELLERLKNRKK